MDEKPVEETLKGLVSLISLLRGKSKEDSEELAYKMHDVIGEYFQALEDSEDKSGVLSLRPDSLLPSTKQAIKDALRQMFLVCTDKELKSILATGYASLASFIPDEEFEETVKSSIESADFKTTNQVRIGTEMKVLIKELTDWCDKTQSRVKQLVKAGQEEPSTAPVESTEGDKSDSEIIWRRKLIKTRCAFFGENEQTAGPLIDEVIRITKSYFDVLAQVASQYCQQSHPHTLDCVKSKRQNKSLLPSDKEKIKEALRLMLLASEDELARQFMIDSYTYLANFVPDEEFNETKLSDEKRKIESELKGWLVNAERMLKGAEGVKGAEEVSQEAPSTSRVVESAGGNKRPPPEAVEDPPLEQ